MEDVHAFLAGLAGYWWNAAHLPEPPAAQGLRALQRRQAEHTLTFLRTTGALDS